jgi:hypothetical protein
MRLFSEPSLLGEFTNAGFRRIKTHSDPFFEFGIYWDITWAVPISARKLISEAKLESVSLPKETNNISFRIDGFSQSKNLFEVEGWAHINGEGSDDARIFIVFKSDENTYVFDTQPIKRSDVSDYFKTSNLDNSGFYAVIPKNRIQKGAYRVGFFIIKDEMEALQFVSMLAC